MDARPFLTTSSPNFVGELFKLSPSDTPFLSRSWMLYSTPPPQTPTIGAILFGPTKGALRRKVVEWSHRAYQRIDAGNVDGPAETIGIVDRPVDWLLRRLEGPPRLGPQPIRRCYPPEPLIITWTGAEPFTTYGEPYDPHQ